MRSAAAMVPLLGIGAPHAVCVSTVAPAMHFDVTHDRPSVPEIL